MRGVRDAHELRLLEQMGVKPVAAVPLVVSGVTVASMNFTASHDRDWPDEEWPRIRIVGEIFASTLESGEAGPVVVVSVEDTGPGLGADAARLFETFYTTKPTGLGMGLPISRSIIERHGGRLWAETNGDGGATFRFSLPLAQA